jgi:hypothetical protein
MNTTLQAYLSEMSEHLFLAFYGAINKIIVFEDLNMVRWSSLNE